jgi:HK97 family phage portal protein
MAGVQVLTANGELADVRSRAYPLAGLDAHQMRSPSSQAIPLGRLPTGETRMLAISRVFRTNPIIQACVNLISRGLSSVPLHTWQNLPNGERRRLRSDLPPSGPGRPPAGLALDRLARQPAPRISRRKLVYRSIQDVAVFGNSLMAFNWGDYGPNELWPIPWRRVVIHTIDPITVLWFDAWGATGRRQLDPDQCIHLTWGDDPESAIGVSPVESLQYTIALHNAIDRHLVSFYSNKATPSGILKVNQMPKDPDIERIREQFKQLYTAPESAGNVVITSGDYTPIAEQTGVPTLVELIKLSWQEILAVYLVDPPMVGIYDQAVRANVKEARAKFYRDTIGPWATLWEDEANVQMVEQNPLWDYCRWEFDLDAKLRPELAERAAIYQQMAETWSVNERRRRENLPDLVYPEAETVWIGSGKIPLGFGVPTTTSDLTPEAPGEPQPEGTPGAPGSTPDGTETPEGETPEEIGEDPEDEDE